MDFEKRLTELKAQGIGGCSQVLVGLSLELTGRHNEDLIRAMSGLTGGMGDSGSACGVLTGGAAAIGYYAGRGKADDIPHPDYKMIVKEYVDWFRDRYGTDRCHDIIGGDKAYARTVCPGIIEAGCRKVRELLEAHGLLEVPVP